MATIAILGTMDTKAEEHAFVAKIIRQRGHEVLIIDVGTQGEPLLKPDIDRTEIVEAAGEPANFLKENRDRGAAITMMSRGAPIILEKLARTQKIDGVISLGGGGGTAIGTAAMRALPIGFPKVMVSTLASGNTEQYIATKDIVMFPSVVDLAGLNRISRQILTRAAGAICGMVEMRPEDQSSDKPLIVASMFGNTTECVQAAKKILEAAGYEVLVFHATGTGGRTMEALIESGMVAGVLDVTTTEWADEMAGGVLSAGPQRLEAAAKLGIPAIITPGCLDMVNFLANETVPKKFAGRNFYSHNPQVTLMRTSVEECAALGKIIAEKLNQSRGPVTFLWPQRGMSAIGAPGQIFYDPLADEALRSALKRNLRADIKFVELDCNINDFSFAKACADTLLESMAAAKC